MRQRLQTIGGGKAQLDAEGLAYRVVVDGEPVAVSPAYADDTSRDAAMQALRAALDALAAV
jgi:hypothetical protein